MNEVGLALTLVVGPVIIVLCVRWLWKQGLRRREGLRAVAEAWGGRYVPAEIDEVAGADAMHLVVDSVPAVVKQFYGQAASDGSADDVVGRGPQTRLRFGVGLREPVLILPRKHPLPDELFHGCEERALVADGPHVGPARPRS